MSPALALLLLLAHGFSPDFPPSSQGLARPRVPTESTGEADAAEAVARSGLLAVLPAAWNHRFDKNHASLVPAPNGAFAFEYARGPAASAATAAPTATPTATAMPAPPAGPGPAGGAASTPAPSLAGVRLVHFTWAKPWDEAREPALWGHERTAMADWWHRVDASLHDSAQPPPSQRAEQTMAKLEKPSEPSEPRKQSEQSKQRELEKREAERRAHGGLTVRITSPKEGQVFDLSVGGRVEVRLDLSVDAGDGPNADALRRAAVAGTASLCRSWLLSRHKYTEDLNKTSSAARWGCVSLQDRAVVPPIVVNDGDFMPGRTVEALLTVGEIHSPSNAVNRISTQPLCPPNQLTVSIFAEVQGKATAKAPNETEKESSLATASTHVCIQVG